MHCAVFRSSISRTFSVLVLAAAAAVCPAASIRGVVTDTSGAKVKGATVTLVSGGKAVAAAVSTADGSFQILTGSEGRFFLLISAKSFRQLETPDFYAGRLDSVEKTLVLEPEWVRESIVVTATGVPTPQSQTSESTTVLDERALQQSLALGGVLRQTPGAAVVQTGQTGGVTSLFVRGGNSTANKILIDGVDAGELGGYFNFGVQSTTALESVEVFRGANSSLYGANAASSVISMRTPHGTTSFPSLLGRFEGGNLNTTFNELTLAGALRKLDYFGSYSWLQTSNNLPNDAFHNGTAAANIGYQPNVSTQLRGTVHYGVSGGGQPNAWDFYHVADDVTQKDQNLIISASIDNQTTAAFHNLVRYGAARKRKEVNQWSMAMNASGDMDVYDFCSLGNVVTITGANGYSATGQAMLDCAKTYNELDVNNRDELSYQGDYRFTPHLSGLIGFRFENERGADVYNSYDVYGDLYAINDHDDRTNYNYLAAVQGDFKHRFYYHLGGSLEHYSLFGTQTSSNAGFSYYLLKPRKGHFNGSRIFGSFGDAVREPKLSDKFNSLYEILSEANETASIQTFHVSPLQAPTTRNYEAGVEQAFFTQRLKFRASYFHNEFGKELEAISTSYLSLLFPDYTVAQLTALKAFITSGYLMTNTQAYRAQGIESILEFGFGANLYMRAGYTYLDAVVQRSFASDNDAQLAGYGYSYNGIPLGSVSPLVGARPFRRPPHSGFFNASYSLQKMTGVFALAFAGHSDDSTYLPGSDQNDGNSLLLPNRNLDHGFVKIDLGWSYQMLNWLGFTTQMENLTNNEQIAPIGYRSLPFTIRSGVKIDLGKAAKR